ncbi:hypothetical protein FQZ97_1158280 [compost metagenome]
MHKVLKAVEHVVGIHHRNAGRYLQDFGVSGAEFGGYFFEGFTQRRVFLVDSYRKGQQGGFLFTQVLAFQHVTHVDLQVFQEAAVGLIEAVDQGAFQLFRKVYTFEEAFFGIAGCSKHTF